MLKIKGLKVRLYIAKWGMIVLTVLVAFGSVGISYAYIGKGWGRGGNPFKLTSFASTVYTSSVGSGVQFSNQMPNDSASLTDLSVGDPAEVGMWSIGDIDDPATWTWSGDVQPEAKEVASIDCAIATEIDPNDTMAIIISNGYPCYFGNVAFTVDNKENFTVKVIGITLIEVNGTAVSEPLVACNTYYVNADTAYVSLTHDDQGYDTDDFSIHLSEIAVDQEMEPGGSGGDTLFGDIAIHVEQGAAQNATYTFRIRIDFESVLTRTCDTAYAYGGGYATCFLDMENVQGNNWGWTNGLLPHGIYTFDLYAGAAGCIISSEKLVGTVDIEYGEAGMVTVTYNLDDGYIMDATHLYIDTEEPLPIGSNGKYVTSPGQYTYQHVLDDATSDTYEAGPYSGGIYIVAHAHVCRYE